MTRDDFAGRVTEMTKPLYYLTCTLLPVQADREDALQNCIVKGLLKCEGLRDTAKFRSWITRILLNECYNLLRQKKRIVLTDTVPLPAQEMDLALHDAVMALPQKQRIALTLQLEGYTAREIAQIVRAPEGTVKTRIRDAKRSLRSSLADEEGVLV